MDMKQTSKDVGKPVFTWEKLSLCVVVEDDCGPRNRAKARLVSCTRLRPFRTLPEPLHGFE